MGRGGGDAEVLGEAQTEIASVAPVVPSEDKEARFTSLKSFIQKFLDSILLMSETKDFAALCYDEDLNILEKQEITLVTESMLLMMSNGNTAKTSSTTHRKSGQVRTCRASCVRPMKTLNTLR